MNRNLTKSLKRKMKNQKRAEKIEEIELIEIINKASAVSRKILDFLNEQEAFPPIAIAALAQTLTSVLSSESFPEEERSNWKREGLELFNTLVLEGLNARNKHTERG